VTVPLLDLSAQYQSLQPELEDAIARVLRSGQFILGPEVAAFEEEFAAFCQAPYAVAVNSGTSALHLALLAAGVGPGDEVITVPFTFAATVAAIHYAGATPVLVDIDPVTYTLDPAGVERALTPRTKALLPVHLYGHPADMDPLLELARRRNLVVIEDAAQAHGAAYRGRPAGSLGDLACFSFYPGKNLGAAGEGGAVVTRHAEYARTIRLLRSWGEERKYHHALRGYNYRLEGLQGAILRVKLRRLAAWIDARRSRAARYRQHLSGVAAPTEQPWAHHAYCLYTVRVPRRDLVQQQLAARGIASAIHYPKPLHLQPAYADPRYREGDFPHAEQAAREVLSLPMYPELRDEQVDAVAAALGDILAAC
jgi:dTDP-4-amino-4,6-dideoxygalactose transaminase